jgi:hypothetical protein
MTKLSEESLLLIQNWDAYQDIVKAGERLTNELQSILSSVEGRLKKETWWNRDWLIKSSGQDQVYLTHKKWTQENTDLVWIGIEGFHADAIYGSSSPPIMYVWINGKRPDLKQEMMTIIRDKCENILGEVDASLQNNYVIRKSLSKCLPEQTETWEDEMMVSLFEFWGFYVGFYDDFSKAIERHLGRSK